MLWMAIGLGLGHAYTGTFGKENTFKIVVFKKDNPAHDEHCLESEELKTGFMKEICIQSDDYEKTPQQFDMVVQGRQTWFGFVLEKYAVQNFAK